MKTSLRFGLGLATSALALATGSARAGSFSTSFPTTAATVTAGGPGATDPNAAGYFFRTGDGVSQTFTGTGLASVDEVKLDFNVPFNGLSGGGFVVFNAELNGTTIGTYAETDSSGIGARHLDYTFAPITGSGTYDFALVEVNQVPSGLGSTAIDYGGTLTFRNSAPVPEASSAASAGLLLALALGGVAVARRRRAAISPE